MTLKCENCQEFFEGPKPKMCCDGNECGCKGIPIDPVVCSEDCGKAIIGDLLFFLYDSRYREDPDRSCVFSTCTSLKEAIKEKEEELQDCVIVKIVSKNDVIVSKEIVG